jgi:ribose-phosphate pyrophosphokinase
MKLFSGRSNPVLASAIADSLGIKLSEVQLRRFNDGEVDAQITDSVRGNDVFVVQPTCPPVNENLMELLVMIDAFKRASAKRITAVMPYFGYARQDRKDKPRKPISAKLVADLLTTAGASRVLSLDLHSGQLQGFFNIPVDNLFASFVFLPYLQRKYDHDLVVVAPDAGGVERARAYAERLEASVALTYKKRPAPGEAEIMRVVGDVEGKTAVIVDDMVDTAGTLCKTAKKLKEMGAVRVSACASHAVLSGAAVDNLLKSDIEELVITDSIPLHQRAKEELKNITIISVADMLGRGIRSVHKNESTQSLFV